MWSRFEDSGLESGLKGFSGWVCTVLLLLGLPVLTSAETPAHQLNYDTVIATDGVPLSIITTGPATTEGIVFVHGFSMSAEVFLPQLQSELATDWRLVAFDLRGHGSSGKPWDPVAYTDSARWASDLEVVRKAAGLDRMILVAWSYGGLTVMDYLRHFGDNHVAAVELVGSLAGLLSPDEVMYDSEFIAEIMASGEMAVSPNLGVRLRAATEFADWLTEKEIPRELHDKLAVMPLLLPPYVLEAMSARLADNTDLRDQLTLPLRFSYGAYDESVPATAVQLLLSRMPSAEAVSYPESGHSPFIEDEHTYNRRLGKFARIHLQTTQNK